MIAEPSVDVVDEFLDALCVARNDHDTVRAALRLADSRQEGRMLTRRQKALVERAINTECNLLDRLYPVGSALRADFETQIAELRDAVVQLAELPEPLVFHQMSPSPAIAAVERSSGALSDPRYVSATCPCDGCVAGRARHRADFAVDTAVASDAPCVRSKTDIYWCATHRMGFAEGREKCEL